MLPGADVAPDGSNPVFAICLHFVSCYEEKSDKPVRKKKKKLLSGVCVWGGYFRFREGSLLWTQLKLRSNSKSDFPLAEASLDSVPLAVDTFEAYGHESKRFLARLFCVTPEGSSATERPGSLASCISSAGKDCQLGKAYPQAGGVWTDGNLSR